MGIFTKLLKSVPVVGDILSIASTAVSVYGAVSGNKASKRADETEAEYAARAQGIEDEARARSDASLGRSARTLREAAGYSKLGTELQLMQADREIYQTQGGIRAQVAANGLRQSGSALDIISSSARQGELEKQILSLKGRAEYASLIGQAQATELQAGITPEEDIVSEVDPNAPTAAQLSEMYPRLLGREWNPVTDAYWLQSGDTAASAESNIAKIGASAPTSTLLQEMYGRVLGRDWNADTDAYWLGSGDTLRSTEQSVQAVGAAAPTAADLQSIYSRLLNRDYNPDTDAYWLKSGDTLSSTSRNIRAMLQVSPGLRVQTG